MIKIITISGLDGSGKSTQVDKLKKYLEKQNHKVFYFHAIQFSILQKIKNVLRRKRPATDASGSVTSSGILGIWLRRAALKLDVWRFKRLLRRLQKQGYGFVLSDRYFYDSAVNIAYLTNSVASANKSIPAPDYAFFLNAEPKSIMLRARKPDQGLRYLQDKNKIYKDFASANGLTTVDGDKQPGKVFESISANINSSLV